DRVDRVQAGVPLQGAERPRAEVDEQREPVRLHQVRRARGLRAGEAARTAEDGQSHGETPAAVANRSAPRNRRASRLKLSGSPVVRSRCTGGGASSGRADRSATSTRNTSRAVSSALDTRVTCSPITRLITPASRG